MHNSIEIAHPVTSRDKEFRTLEQSATNSNSFGLILGSYKTIYRPVIHWHESWRSPRFARQSYFVFAQQSLDVISQITGQTDRRTDKNYVSKTSFPEKETRIKQIYVNLQLIGLILNDSEWLRMATNDCEWLRMAANSCEWPRMALSGCEWLRMAANGSEWQRMAASGYECPNAPFPPWINMQQVHFSTFFCEMW